MAVEIQLYEISHRPQPPPIEHRINKIPNYLYNMNEQAYTPKVISIGPVHHANPNLQGMEKYKQRYLERFIARIGELDLEYLRRTIWEMKDEILYFYEEINLSGVNNDAELMAMILPDATFILEFFLKIYTDIWESEDLRIERQRAFILLDLVLLENQCFSYRNLQKKQPMNMTIVHFTHLMRTFQLPPPETLQGNRGNYFVFHSYSASQLQDAGVKLMVNTSSKCLLHIEFEGEVLKIPRLNFYDDTEALFLNIIAFEEFHSRDDIKFMDYCKFMDMLVDTAEDIKLLCDNGILVNYLGEKNSAASFFNRLNRYIYAPGFHQHFALICEDLDKFCKQPRNRWKATLRHQKATLRHQYFSSPWRAASTIAAIILLLLTFIQTVCSIVK